MNPALEVKDVLLTKTIFLFYIFIMFIYSYCTSANNGGGFFL